MIKLFVVTCGVALTVGAIAAIARLSVFAQDVYAAHKGKKQREQREKDRIYAEIARLDQRMIRLENLKDQQEEK